MTLPTRTTEPTSIIAGETLEWTKSYYDYPASLWHLTYYFRGPGVGFNAAWGVEVAAASDDFVITVPTTKTDDMTVAGRYKWEAWVTEIANSSNKQLVGSGYAAVSLALNQSTTAAAETRTEAKIMLDAIDAALLAFNTSDVQEYEVSFPSGKRRVQRSDKEQLLGQRKYWAGIVTTEIAREGAKNGKPLMTSIKMRVYDR